MSLRGVNAAVAACALMAAHADEPPRRPAMVEKVRSWARLPPDDAVDLILNLRDAEVRDAVARGGDDVVPLLGCWARHRGDDLGAILAPLLDVRKPSAATRTVRIIEASRRADAGQEAVALLPESHGNLRRAVVEMAASLALPEAEAAFTAELGSESSAGDIALLLSGLASLPGDEPRVSLLPYLSDEDPLVRLQAARAIARVPAEDCLLALQSRLEQETEPRVRRELVLAVGALGGAPEMAELRTCLGRPLPRLERALCLEALAANPGDDATRALVGIYTSKGSDLRREAATALGARPDTLARTTLLSGAEKEEDPAVFRFVAAALGRLGEARARTRLVLGLEDPNVALFCAIALAEMGDAEGASVLRLGLQDREYRETCLRALTRLKDAAAEPAVLKLYGAEDRLDVKVLALDYLLALP